MDGLIKKWKRSGAKFKLVRDLEMKKRSTLGVGGVCKYALFPADFRALAIMSDSNVPVFGRCSNVLISDAGLQTAIFTDRLDRIVIRDGLVMAECGVNMPTLAKMTARCGYTGMEPLSGIPGTVGGAIRMNAGCFGTDVADLLVSVSMATSDGIVTLNAEQMDFGYRRSAVPELGTVLSATFRLKSCDFEGALNKIDVYTAERKRRFPVGKSCGCYFKRVEGVSAGYFVEKAGLKGLRIGGAEVSNQHGAFIMNVGGATAEDIITLSNIVKEEVKRVCSVILEEEVQLYGKF